MMSNQNTGEIRIIVVDAAELVNGEAEAETPNVEGNIAKALEKPKTKGKKPKDYTTAYQRALMPMINDVTGGMGSQAMRIRRNIGSINMAFKEGVFMLGGALIAKEIYQIAKQAIADEKAKAEKENSINLMKIRTGELQFGAGVYSSKTNIFGKVKYNNN